MTIRNSVCEPAIAEEARKKWVGTLVWWLDVFGNARALCRVTGVEVTEWDKVGRVVQEVTFKLQSQTPVRSPRGYVAGNFVLPFDEGVKRGFKP